MPWAIRQNFKDCDGWAVVNEDTEEVEGCHDTEEEAVAQQAALYANAPEGEDLAAEVVALADDTVPGEFHGPLVIEGVPTGDGREFAMNAVTWRDPPLPLMWLVEDAHGGEPGASYQVGRIDRLVRRGGEVWGYGAFDLDDDYGAEAARKVHQGFLRGISVDLDADADVEMLLPEEDGETADDDLGWLFGPPPGSTLLFHQATIMGATLCAFPALAGAHLRSGPGNPEADVEPAEVTAVVTAAGEVGLLLGGKIVPATLVRMNGDRFTVDLMEPEAPQTYTEWVADSPSPPAEPTAPDLAVSPPASEEEEAAPSEAVTSLVEAVLALSDADRDDFDAALEEADEAAEDTEETPANLLASGMAHLLTPPADWFTDPDLPGPCHLTVEDSGRVYGHLALWNACHIGFQGQCITPPRSATSYATYRSHEVICSDGSRVATGVISLGTDHADIALNARPAKVHYDHTGSGVADVAVGEDEWGIWLAGSMRPTATPEEFRLLRASGVSGDWRGVPGIGSELVAVLAVNVPGFPVPRLAARLRGDTALAIVAGAAFFTAEQERDAIAARIGRTKEVRRLESLARVHPERVGV